MTLPMSHGPRSRFQWLRFGAVFASLFGSYQVVEDVRGFSAGMLATTKLYVVRHGAVIPPGGRTAAIYGGAEVELSETGKAEAQAAAEYLMSEVPLLDAVYSSGLKRAIYGAESICGGRGLQPIKDSRFNEINRGVWVGLTRDEIAERYPDHVRSIGSLSTFEGDPEFSGHGGESYRALGRRVLEGRDSLLLKHPGSTICVVCHNWVVAALVGDASGIPPEQWCTLKIPTASVSLLEILHHKANEDDDDSMVIKDQKVVFAGKSPADYTGGRLAENVGSVFFSGKG
ncbi:unnamed protein product [Polarella glacialis]|uniref:Histidine phosphatase family protein n=1 Tax=Polarella glacialis TaxID=89957 RepID=A0A813M4S7_POLGL|nr:unnamed protein product [Polarella glacialis]